MNNLELQEAPIFAINRLDLSSPIDEKSKRLKIAGIVIGVVTLLAFALQFLWILSQQRSDMSALGDKIQQLEHDDLDLKNSIEVQANSTKSISSELNLTKTRLESTRQDLSATQSSLVDTEKKLDSQEKELFDFMKTEFNAQNLQLREYTHEMTEWKQGYNTVMADYSNKDEGYRNDIKDILQKIQSLDIGSINDKVYELQMSVMDLEKKLIAPGQSPFVDHSQKI